MDFQTLVHDRRSTRGFRADPPPEELIREIIADAVQAPSSMNSQPWNFHVIGGDALDRIRQGNMERMMSGAKPNREIQSHGGYTGAHRDRQKAVAAQLFEAMGIPWDDKTKRTDWAMRGFRQFEAPLSVVVTLDANLAHSHVCYFDLGAVTYGMVLAAWDRGVGCVINGQGISQSDVVREYSNIPEDQLIMITVAMGWPLEDFPANDVQSARRPVDEVVTFVS
ncbi:MAG: nitroreductase [Actinomycetota bacterium]